MFGLEFLFGAALWALPLAGLPVVLHLLFKRKSPIMQFSTVRFIKMSIQRTAARKRVQKWLLLACRALLLLLLIWAIAQPAKMLASGWASSGRSMIAAVVVDTSYSMQLQDQKQPLAARADGMVQDLLRDQLKNAQVAIFRSRPAPADNPEQLQSPGKLLSEWTPLKPEASVRPLVDQVAAAAELLKSQPGEDKWLVVISDFQKKEFPHPMPPLKEGRIILLNVAPEEARSAGITRVAIEPPQPIPGIGSEAVVDVVGHSGKSRPVVVTVTSPDGQKLAGGETLMAGLDSAGRARLRFPLRLPAQQWMLLKASFQDEDDMAWDNTRTQLIEVPPRQVVSLLASPDLPQAQRFIRLALDPSEGKIPSWPLSVKDSDDLAADADVAVLDSSTWPDAPRAARLLNFVRGGGTFIWFLRPGLEETWTKLPQNERAVLGEMLPSEPLAGDSVPAANSLAVATADSPLLSGLTDERYQIGSIAVRRLVPFSVVDPAATVLLHAFPSIPTPGARPRGILFHRGVGAGTVYTFSTSPDPQFTGLATHPLFLPLMVRMGLKSSTQTDARNVELGQPVALPSSHFAGISELRLQGPQGDISAVRPVTINGVTGFLYDHADAPGLYTWRKPDSDKVLALANVQLPASESELTYVPADSVAEASDNIIVARSLGELAGKFASMNEPSPQWSGPIAIILFLMCLEALMGSTSQVWKAPNLRAFLPKLHGPA